MPALQRRLAESCTNQTRLWREIRAQGFTGTRSLVAKWLNAYGLDQAMLSQPKPLVLPPDCQLAWLLMQDEDKRTVDKQTLLSKRYQDVLPAWLQACQTSRISELKNVVMVLRQDDEAVDDHTHDDIPVLGQRFE